MESRADETTGRTACFISLTNLRAVPGPTCRWQQRVSDALVALAMLVLRVAVWNCVELGAGKATVCSELPCAFPWAFGR